MFEIIPEDEWILELNDGERTRRLQEPIPPEDIIDRMITDVRPDKILSQIVACEDRVGFSRYESEIEVDSSLYDLFFHGRSGYRAQYYFSMECGENYNQRVIRQLFPIIAHHESGHPQLSLIAASLLQTNSKVTWYNSNDGLLYHGREDILKPARWVDYWQRQPQGTVPMGHKDFLLDNCRLFIKGSFVNTVGDIHISKPNRARQLYESGWT